MILPVVFVLFHIACDPYAAKDCNSWMKPCNDNDYPLWPYCNRKKGDSQYPFMEFKLTPAGNPPHVCSGTKVLRHDAAGLLCADYTKGDGFGGPCTDATCCAEGICSDYKCKKGTLRGNANQISCVFDCNDETCCNAPAGVPRLNAQGFVFVDRDPKLYSYGGSATIIRATDESDITHYRVYWAFAHSIRKVPSCGLRNPVSWTQVKWRDNSKLFKEFKVTGCDITFDIPMGTLPNERCKISTDKSDRTRSHTDICNPHYWVVVSVNANGEKPILVDQSQQIGPKYAISDYDGSENLPCGEAGLTMGHDLPAEDDVVLGKWNGVPSAAACAELCRSYKGPTPCRYWTWAWPSGGSSQNSCWVESQTMQVQHYSVRWVGPAVCPTPNGAAPVGIERPRCDRWIRIPNMAPFDNNKRTAWTSKGGLYNERPNTDTPLGPFDNGEACQALCDLDVLCIGFVWMKKDPSDAYFHKCLMIRVSDPLQASPFYDTWFCSREGMAPLVLGYDINQVPFGYKECTNKAISTQSSVSPDCCAAECDSDTSCTQFTYDNAAKSCSTYSSCTSKSVTPVEFCAYESCYGDNGKTTYKKRTKKLTIVDRWPAHGDSNGIPIYLQTEGGIEGETVNCITTTSNKAWPKGDVDSWRANPFYKDAIHQGIVVDGVAEIIVKNYSKNPAKPVEDGQEYTVTCLLAKATAGYEAKHIYHTVRLNNPKFDLIGQGFCRSQQGCPVPGVVVNQGSFTYCRQQCLDKGDCVAFWWRLSDGWCHLKTPQSKGGCSYSFVNSDANIECWAYNKNSMAIHSIGNDKCEKTCPGTCRYSRQMGKYTRNYFLPTTKSCSTDDECIAKPCGEQLCNDPNPTAMSKNDYTCTCKSDNSITATGKLANCVKDECDPNPCGTDQDCLDPDTSAGSLNDYECSCKSNSMVTKTGSPADCPVDECDPSPCGSDQDCNDPDTSSASTDDYICTCKADSSTKATGASAICTVDECDASPCGSNQDCNDPDTSSASTDDYICTCKADSSIKATGASAICTVDECDASPCGSGQTCEDPNKGYDSQHDYICTCISDPTLKKIDDPAICEKDECSTSPCGTDQTCNDPDPSPKKLKDFICSCKDDPSIKATGSGATCSVDECTSTPCGNGQTCDDPNKSYSSQHDFICTCDSDMSVSKVDSPAVCNVDECLKDPCGTDQTCNDSNQSPKNLKDFVCSCKTDTTITATGSKATCNLDECTLSPCGMNQVCDDPNKSYSSQHDFSCTCASDSSITKVNGPALCSKDECDKDPCGSEQVCSDPDPSPKSLKDFSCSCKSDMTLTATGTAATCTLDECQSTPCGSDQTCNDPDKGYRSQSDYVCSCISDTSITKIASPALCSKNECDKAPCGTEQTCTDPDPSPNSIKDYICTCKTDTSLSSTGTKATCTLDECIGDPCGSQICNDPNKSYASQHDYTCTCASDSSIFKVDGEAKCTKDECASNPCGNNQSCNDTNTSPKSVKDFKCSCDNDPTVTSTGTAATCTRDECLSQPCGMNQTCDDPNKAYSAIGDYTCTCISDSTISKVNSPALCVSDECQATPCGSDQSCNDPNTNPNSLQDFICSCLVDTSITSTGTSALCTLNECDVIPCETDQDCADPTTSRTALHDFVCSCKSDPSTSAIGVNAKCVIDECVSKPCGSQQCLDSDTKASVTGDFTCTCANGIQNIGDIAICSSGNSNECDQMPCGGTQKCVDPHPEANSLNDYQCSCTAGTGTMIGAPAACQVDECITVLSPCGTSAQACSDKNTDSSSLLDWECLCKPPATGSATGQEAICVLDECSPDPCGATQTCMDMDTSPTSISDFICSCPNGVTAKGGSATCESNECDSTPCGNNQTCNDPDISLKSRNDFICSCILDPTLTQIGSPATCDADECAGAPCGTGQTCSDPNKSFTSLSDYTCNCSNGASATGGPAKCEIDECVGDPCGPAAQQTCVDPNKSYLSQHDYICTCVSDPTRSKVDDKAKCDSDECLRSPCEGSQVCFDPNPSFSSLSDFTCTCNNGVFATGGPATCEIDECLADPCGLDQTCSDPDVSYKSQHDFVCTCDKDQTLIMIDGPAVCEADECYSDPCGGNQTCFDPNMNFTSLLDYTCTCPNGVSSIGGAATCELNECVPNPCGDQQECSDPNISYKSQHDFVCTCLSNSSLTNIDAPAQCDSNECANNPCGLNQTCDDPDQTFASLSDYICTCANGVSSVGGRATCEVDECDTIPCGLNQTCIDPDKGYTSQHNFICQCISDPTRVAVGGPATCSKDECLITPSPCGPGQTCTDPNTSFSSLSDYICGCDNGVSSSGGVATCDINECLATPCGLNQTCFDPNTSYHVQHDYICTCFGSSVSKKDGPAKCIYDECRAKVCGDQACVDPDKDSTKLNNYICTCENGITSVGKPPLCSSDECEYSPCGKYQSCLDLKKSPDSMGDYICSCDYDKSMSARNGTAKCVFDECKASPCGRGQRCLDHSHSEMNDFTCICLNDNSISDVGKPAVCGDIITATLPLDSPYYDTPEYKHLGNAASTTGSEDDAGPDWLIVILIATASLLFLIALVVTIVRIRRRSQAVSIAEFHRTISEISRRESEASAGTHMESLPDINLQYVPPTGDIATRDICGKEPHPSFNNKSGGESDWRHLLRTETCVNITKESLPWPSYYFIAGPFPLTFFSPPFHDQSKKPHQENKQKTMNTAGLFLSVFEKRCTQVVDRIIRLWSDQQGHQKVIEGLVSQFVNAKSLIWMGSVLVATMACRSAVKLFELYGYQYCSIIKRLYPKSWKQFESSVESLFTRSLQTYTNDCVQLMVALSLASLLQNFTTALLPRRFESFFHLCDFCYGMAHFRIKCSISILLPPIARRVVGLPLQGTLTEKEVSTVESDLGCVEFYIAESFLMVSKLIAGTLLRNIYVVQKPHIKRQSILMLSSITFLTPLAHIYRELNLKWYHVFVPVLATFWQVLLKSGCSSVFSGIFYYKYYHRKGVCGMIIPWAYLFMLSYEEMIRASEEAEEEEAAAATATTHTPDTPDHISSDYRRGRRGSFSVDVRRPFAQGTNRTLLRSFTESKILTDEEVASLNNEVCIICQGGYEDERRTRHLTCGHFFHQNCADEWLLRHRICPLCRKDPITTESVYSIEDEHDEEMEEE